MLHQLSPPDGHGQGLWVWQSFLWSTQQCCPPISSSVCPFFFHLEQYLGWWSLIGHWLLSHVCTHMVFFSSLWSAALHSVSCVWWWLHILPHFVICSVYEIPSTLLKHVITTAWISLCRCAVSVHVSQVYEKIDVTNANCSFSLEERLVLLSLHMSLSLSLYMYISVYICISLSILNNI